MRQNELTQGVDVVDDDNNIVGKSRVAAVKGISEVKRNLPISVSMC